jgi:predicted dehydrogenase
MPGAVTVMNNQPKAKVPYSMISPRAATLPAGRQSRRHFLKQTAAGITAATACGPYFLRGQNLNSKLNIGVIGTGGKGASDTDGCAHENIVALCDIDGNTLRERSQKYPKARQFRDFRKMIETLRELDAVTVSTPDHVHAPAAMTAIRAGKHVYVQKPLTHSIWEARQLRLAAREHKVASMMGNQGHAGEGIRHFCELIWAGVIGPVREVHAWTDRPIWPQAIPRPTDSPPVPAHIDWDLWLGPAPWRPYNSAYHPFKWRGWWDFGTGALGDMGCHVLDGVNWALKLGHPTAVEAKQEGANDETGPAWAEITYEFPAREGMPPLKLTWHDGKKKPSPELAGGPDALSKMDNGVLVIGDQGKLITGPYGDDPRFTADSGVKEFPTVGKTLPRSIGHYEEWIQACKGGPNTGANFDYAGPFTEWVLLGNLAVRAGKKLDWDGENMTARNAPEVSRFVHREYRKGWEV